MQRVPGGKGRCFWNYLYFYLIYQGIWDKRVPKSDIECIQYKMWIFILIMPLYDKGKWICLHFWRGGHEYVFLDLNFDSTFINLFHFSQYAFTDLEGSCNFFTRCILQMFLWAPFCFFCETAILLKFVGKICVNLYLKVRTAPL